MITQEYLKECLDYNPETGLLFWKIRPREHFKSDFSQKMFNGKYAGKEAGGVHACKSGDYKRLKINKKNILNHRIIWMINYGVWPNQIDHINGDGLDNKINNLRNVEQSQNMKNRKISSNNKTRIMGVYWYKRNEKWGVRIGSENNNKYIGLYDDFFEACCVRKSLENKLIFHENHGRGGRP